MNKDTTNIPNKKRDTAIGCLSIIVILFFIGSCFSVENGTSNKQEVKETKVENQVDKGKEDSQQNEQAAINEKIESICKDSLSSKFIKVEINDDYSSKGTKLVLVNFKATAGLSNQSTRELMLSDTTEILSKLCTAGLPISTYNVLAHLKMIDKFGNESDEVVMKATITNETALKVNWINIDPVKLPQILDSYYLYPSLKVD